MPEGRKFTTSPILFDIYTEPILIALEEVNIFSQMYADDLVCVCNSKEESMKAISIVARIANELRLTLNPRKSGILRLGTYLGRTLTATPHMAKAGGRANYIGRVLWVCRH